MENKELISRIQKELITALNSRAAGNQGRARVCARRAAGWAAQEYFDQNGISYDSSSALKHLHQLAGIKGFPEKYYQVVHHLTIKLEKDSFDQEAYYPIKDVDLIAEAHWLAEELLQEKIDLSK